MKRKLNVSRVTQGSKPQPKAVPVVDSPEYFEKMERETQERISALEDYRELRQLAELLDGVRKGREEDCYDSGHVAYKQACALLEFCGEGIDAVDEHSSQAEEVKHVMSAIRLYLEIVQLSGDAVSAALSKREHDDFLRAGIESGQR